MAGVSGPADFADPEVVGQTAAALGQLHRDGLATGQGDAMRAKLLGSPIVFWKLVIGQQSDSLLPQLTEQIRTVAFPIDDHCEPVGAGIASEPLLLVGTLGHR